MEEPMLIPANNMASILNRNGMLSKYAVAFETKSSPPVVAASVKAIHVKGSISTIN